MKKLLLISFFAINSLFAFDKVIIWGHKLHSHTHSYVHNAFYKAFKYLGYETYWFDDQDDTSHFNFSNSLFLTEGQVDNKIPLRSDCRYILHNCGAKYRDLIIAGKAFNLQVYSDDVLERPYLEKLAPCIYANAEQRILHMPWATDLLPEEIEANKALALSTPKESKIYWIGTVGGGTFGNLSELEPFMAACKKNGLRFIQKSHISDDEHRKLIMKSFMAPTIVGEWQKEHGYIPCRIFKNISYGQFGITNSERVYELFEGKILYDSDTEALFNKALKKLKTVSQYELLALMDFVKENHTYINRIELLLFF